MMKPLYISNSVRNLITATLTLCLLTLAAYTSISMYPFIGRSFPGFVVLGNNLVPTVGLPGWEGLDRGIKFTDIVTAVDGQSVTDGDSLYAYVASKAPGTMVEYTILRAGQERDISVPVGVFTAQDYALLMVLMVFGTFFCAMGVVVFHVRPNSAAARAFLVNGGLVGLTLAGTPVYVTVHVSFISLLTLPLVGPSFTLLGLYFPEKSPARKYIIPIVFGLAAPILLAYYFTFDYVRIFTKVDFVFLLFLSCNNILGFYLMGRSFYQSESPLTRQKAKVVIFGFSLTFAFASVFVIGNLILKIMILFWFLPVGLVMLPASIAYAILKNNLFDVDVFIRRSISYILVSGITMAMAFAVISLISLVLQNVTGQSSQIAAVATTVLALVVIRPLYVRIDGSLDRRFFRERYEYHTTIRKASQVLISIVELEPLLGQIVQTVTEAVKVQRGCVLIHDGQNPGSFIVKAAAGYARESLPPLPADSRAAAYLAREKRPITLGALEELKDYRDEQRETLEFMNSLKAVLLVPVVYEGETIGMLCLGEKKSGNWYSSDDIELFQTLMLQTAVSIDNARKVEELKKMVQLETSYRELEQIDKMKDNLLHMVSHDLRTPMTAIMGYAYMLHDEDEQLDGAARRDYLDIIIKEGERLTRLINDLLDLNRFEAGRMDLELEPLDLAETARDSVNLFKGAVEQKKIELTSDIPNEEIKVMGHRDRLSQIMSNLLSNAVKFTPAGGTVAVRMRRIEENGRPARVRVEVADTGKGVPDELKPRIFDKFQQARDDAQKSGGSGLGLALVKEIVEYHGGEVGLESEPGKGAVFHFTLEIIEGGGNS